MKKLLLISMFLIAFISVNAQEFTLEQLFTITYVSVKSELRAKHLEKRFFKFGIEREYFEATYDGKERYFLEISENEYIVLDKGLRKHLLTKRLRKKLIEIKYQ